MRVRITLEIAVRDPKLLLKEGTQLYIDNYGDASDELALGEAAWEVISSGKAPLDYGFEILNYDWTDS